MSGFKHISDISFDYAKAESLSTGFPSLDSKLLYKKGVGGLHVLGARPGVGKSALMFQKAAHVARTGTVFSFSIEMADTEIWQRLVAIETGRGLTQVISGDVPEQEVVGTKAKFHQLKLYINDAGLISVEQMMREINELSVDAGAPDMIVIDYLGKIDYTATGNKAHDLGRVAAELKQMAKEYGCPVLVGAQLNRQSLDRGRMTGDYTPILSDLKDSGGIEAEADTVELMHCPYEHDKGQPEDLTILDIAKFRSGRVGRHPLTFLKASVCFKDGHKSEGTRAQAKVVAPKPFEMEIL